MSRTDDAPGQPAELQRAAARTVVRWNAGNQREDVDELAPEEPLEIRLCGRPISVTMRTPGHDEELAAGLLLAENLVRSRDDVLDVQPCERGGNRVNVVLAPGVEVDFARLTRHFAVSSSCGLCGKASIEAVCGRAERIGSGLTVSADLLSALPGAMRTAQAAFDRTGGLHAAAVFDAAGRLLVLREDVGRHNAVDKVIGRALLDGLLPLDRHILLVSGRVSFEIVQKALAAGVPILAAVSAPSELAAAFAERAGQTLVGFLRQRRMNVYSHPWRVRAGAEPAG